MSSMMETRTSIRGRQCSGEQHEDNFLLFRSLLGVQPYQNLAAVKPA